MFPRLRHVFQCSRAGWQYYEAHADELHEVVIETMVKPLCLPAGHPPWATPVWRCSCGSCDHTKRICFTLQEPQLLVLR